MLHKTFNNVSKKLITTAAFDELDRALMWAVAALFALSITLGRTRKFIPPNVVQVAWGWMEPLPGVFWYMLNYFETILPLVESFWSSKQDEVYFMGSVAAGGLWRHQQWSPSWPPSWIFLRIRNQVKTSPEFHPIASSRFASQQRLPGNDRPLMRSSDVTTTRKPGSDFDWLIV